MADLTREGKNMQKRGVSVSVSEKADTGANIFFNLPHNTLVIGAYVEVLTADSTAGATVDVKVNGTVVGNELAVDSIGTKEGTITITSTDGTTTVTGDIPYTTPTYFATGGQVEIAAGSTDPAGDGELRLILEYIELDKTTGEYTNV